MSDLSLRNAVAARSGRSYAQLLAAGRKWRVLRSEVAMMELSQSDEMGFSSDEIEPFRLALEDAERELQMAVDALGAVSVREQREILFPGLRA